MAVFIVARLIQGTGRAGVDTMVFAMLRDRFPEDQAKVLGLAVASGAFAFTLGPPVGAAIGGGAIKAFQRPAFSRISRFFLSRVYYRGFHKAPPHPPETAPTSMPRVPRAPIWKFRPSRPIL